jgi:hypothetical protein
MGNRRSRPHKICVAASSHDADSLFAIQGHAYVVYRFDPIDVGADVIDCPKNTALIGPGAAVVSRVGRRLKLATVRFEVLRRPSDQPESKSLPPPPGNEPPPFCSALSALALALGPFEKAAMVSEYRFPACSMDCPVASCDGPSPCTSPTVMAAPSLRRCRLKGHVPGFYCRAWPRDGFQIGGVVIAGPRTVQKPFGGALRVSHVLFRKENGPSLKARRSAAR